MTNLPRNPNFQQQITGRQGLVGYTKESQIGFDVLFQAIYRMLFYNDGRGVGDDNSNEGDRFNLVI